MKDEKDFIKLRCTVKQCEVYHNKYRLCCFGNDLWIKDDCNINYESYSSLGYTYERPPENDRYALAGS